MPKKWSIKIVALCSAALSIASPRLCAAEVGLASYYGAGEKLNSHTAMNIPFDARLLECASWSFPLGSVLKVTSLRTGRTVVVRCTDRGPAKKLNRLVDLTKDAFSLIDDLKQGLTPVEVIQIK